MSSRALCTTMDCSQGVKGKKGTTPFNRDVRDLCNITHSWLSECQDLSVTHWQAASGLVSDSEV